MLSYTRHLPCSAGNTSCLFATGSPSVAQAVRIHYWNPGWRSASADSPLQSSKSWIADVTHIAGLLTVHTASYSEFRRCTYAASLYTNYIGCFVCFHFLAVLETKPTVSDTIGKRSRTEL